VKPRTPEPPPSRSCGFHGGTHSWLRRLCWHINHAVVAAIDIQMILVAWDRQERVRVRIRDVIHGEPSELAAVVNGLGCAVTPAECAQILDLSVVPDHGVNLIDASERINLPAF